MRRKFIAGNWKMNTGLAETVALIQALIDNTQAIENTTIMVAPPFTNLQTAREHLKNSKIKLGGQNIYWEDKGAYTGEISGPMLKDLGCTYVIIGHSERRQYFKESIQDVNRKVHAALRNNLLPIVCVGETLDQRQKGRALASSKQQIRNGLKGFSSDQVSKLTVAYEPIWAIGTGQAATPADAVEVHSLIRSLISELFGNEVAQSVRILYGGSVTADNIESFIREPEIDGALVGGASLKVDAFVRIIEVAESA